MHILPVASGKGGVGKSLVSANLAIALGQAGKRVVLVDLDLGGSNLHTMLGMRAVRRGVGTFITDSDTEFGEIIVGTDYRNLRFIPGDGEIPGMANLKVFQKKKLIRNLTNLDADFLIMDLGSGTTFNTLDFFLMSQRGIVVTNPTLTAVLNAYLFIKNSLFRLIDHSFSSKSPASDYLAELRAHSDSLQRMYLPNILPELKERDPEGYDTFTRQRRAFRPHLVLNMLEDPKDGAKAGKLRRSCTQYLGIDLEHLGVLYRDVLQDGALDSGLPILVYKPRAVLSQEVVRIADKLIEEQIEAPGGFALDAVVAGASEDPVPDEGAPAAGAVFAGAVSGAEVDQSYQTAEMEAEIDFASKIQDMNDLLHSGALTQGDLIETIRTQHYEISQLRKENSLLKSKLVKAADAGYDI